MDNFIVSARKYRPITFDSVVGQPHITNTLKNAIKNKQLAQAFLFCGPRGVGKTTCARILAKTINCENPTQQIEPCGTCRSCESFAAGASMSIHELDAASNNSVDDIRMLNEQVRIPPQSGNFKIYIIDEVHMLSSAAFNAFLKTLEEPPSYAIFILATTEKHKILPTILSRCQIFDFNRIKVEAMASHLESIAKKEEIAYDLDGLHLIAQKADGGLRDALSMFDQIVSFSDKNITYQSVIDNLNILDYDYYFKLTDAICGENVAQALLLFDEILQNGFDGNHFISGLADHFRNLLVAKDSATVQLLEVSQGIKEKYLSQSGSAQVGVLLSALSIANQCELNYKNSKNQRLQVELALIKMCHLAAAIQLDRSGATTNSGDKKKTSDRNGLKTEEAGSSAVLEPTSAAKVEVKKESPVESSPQKKEPVANGTEQQETPGQPEKKSTDPQATKLVIPKLKDIVISSSVPNLDSFLNRSNSKQDEEPEYLTGTEKEVFTESSLLEHWNVLANQFKQSGRISLFTLMTANSPKLESGYEIEVIVENSVQEHLLVASKIEILNYLRSQLRNYFINLKTVIQTNTIVRKPVTDIEKYQAMVLKNPILETLRKDFNLGFQ